MLAAAQSNGSAASSAPAATSAVCLDDRFDGGRAGGVSGWAGLVDGLWRIHPETKDQFTAAVSAVIGFPQLALKRVCDCVVARLLSILPEVGQRSRPARSDSAEQRRPWEQRENDTHGGVIMASRKLGIAKRIQKKRLKRQRTLTRKQGDRPLAEHPVGPTRVPLSQAGWRRCLRCSIASSSHT